MKNFFIFGFILTSFFSIGLEKVEAISWQNTLTVCEIGPCNTYPYFNVTVNSDKHTYDPGENIALSSTMEALYCSNNAAVYTLSSAISGDTALLADFAVVEGGEVHYSSGVLTAPTIPGTYDIDLTSCHYVYGVQCSTASMTITVKGTPPPEPPPPPPTAIISGTNCKIPSGASTCSGTLTWVISGATNPNVYHNNGTTYSTSPSGSSVPALLGYGLNTVYARDGGTTHASTNVLTECEIGLAWVDGACGLPTTPPPPPPVVSVNFEKKLIRSGETAVTNTTVMASYPASCTLYGVNSTPIVFPHAGHITPTKIYDYTTRPLTSAQVVTVTCVPSPAINGVSAASAESRVDVIPTVQEI